MTRSRSSHVVGQYGTVTMGTSEAGCTKDRHFVFSDSRMKHSEYYPGWCQQFSCFSLGYYNKTLSCRDKFILPDALSHLRRTFHRMWGVASRNMPVLYLWSTRSDLQSSWISRFLDGIKSVKIFKSKSCSQMFNSLPVSNIK